MLIWLPGLESRANPNVFSFLLVLLVAAPILVPFVRTGDNDDNFFTFDETNFAFIRSVHKRAPPLRVSSATSLLRAWAAPFLIVFGGDVPLPSPVDLQFISGDGHETRHPN